jgi:hypothetical protein
LYRAADARVRHRVVLGDQRRRTSAGATIPVPGTAAIRDDIDVPVLTLETESDLTLLNYFSARQDDDSP